MSTVAFHSLLALAASDTALAHPLAANVGPFAALAAHVSAQKKLGGKLGAVFWR